ncbi:TlpA family protein disulfide reductase [Microlunatus elymi]|uniref:TlpA family protein disulfide reductase n=1 Tax=Microlunatus elymi TaxID=2596828 RepID=A0A516Q487_9ACTN|nr:TlpA disulfide reductase family protein [Microlunatus elymi]QDP98267.1 TlpA family protein disulfide reductase [Microlunatus elymi]
MSVRFDSRAQSKTPGRKLAPLLAIVMILVGLAGCSTDSAGADSQTGSENGYVGSDQQLTRVAPKDRAKAPEISGPSLTDPKKTINSSDYAGKVIVYNVWGSWCAPCRKEAPDLQAASDETAKVSQFIGINSRDTGTAQPQAFVRANKITYPSIYDPDGSQVVKFENLPPSAIPSTLIIDKQGRVAVRILGSITKATLVDMIDDVAEGK